MAHKPNLQNHFLLLCGLKLRTAKMTSSTNFFLGIFLIILVVFFIPSKGMTDIILMSQDNTSYGCIDCDQRAEQSICNAYGKYGSIYSEQSIWNKNGIGNINKKESPFNKGGRGLGLFNSQGNFEGYFAISDKDGSRYSEMLKSAWHDSKQSHAKSKAIFCRLIFGSDL